MGKNKNKKSNDYDTYASESNAYSAGAQVIAAMEKEKAKCKNGIRFLVFMFATLIIFCLTAFVTKEDEYSVVKQFGSIVRVEKEPGLSFRIPIIQQVKKVNRQVLFYDIVPSDVITSDKKTMIADAFVLWEVTDPELYFKTLSASRTNAEGRLNTIVYNALKNTISNMTQNEVILSRDGKIVITDIGDAEITNNLVVDDDETDDVVKIKSLTEEIKENLEDTSGYGVHIVKAEVKILDLPESNKTAVYERMISERDNVAASYIAQGKSAAQMIINTTDKEVAIMQAQAEADAASIIAEGEKQYMSILSDAYNDESKADFYSFVRALDAAKASLKGNNNTLILDQNSPITQIFYGK